MASAVCELRMTLFTLEHSLASLQGEAWGIGAASVETTSLVSVRT